MMVWPDTGAAALLIIFGIHFAVFVLMALRSHRLYQWMAVTAFGLLIAAIVISIWWPAYEIFNRPLHHGLRVLAWIATAVAAVLFLRHRRSNR